MGVNENGVQVERQYIGARYVPKFFQGVAGSPEWVAGLAYEALTIVTYLGNSFTSKVPVPAGVGNPADNPDYWANTGNLNPQLNAIRDQLTQLQNSIINPTNGFINVDKLRNSNVPVNSVAYVSGHTDPNDGGSAFYWVTPTTGVDNDGDNIKTVNGTALLIHENKLHTKVFGCGNSDDSLKFQNMINYAKINGIRSIILDSDISIKDVTVENMEGIEIDLNGYTINLQAFNENTSAVHNAIKFVNCGTVTIKNGNIKGVAKIPNTTKTLPMRSPIEIFNASSCFIKNVVFSSIYNKEMEFLDTYIKLRGAALTIHDVNNSYINNCTFLNIEGEELMYVWPDNKLRSQINLEACNNAFTNIDTSNITFLGNTCYQHDNVFNSVYPGSITNTFGLNVIIERETVYGEFDNGFDNSETDQFQGDTYTASNIMIYGQIKRGVCLASAKKITIDNIKTESEIRIFAFTPGYGSEYAAMSPYTGKTALDTVYVDISNIDDRHGSILAYVFTNKQDSTSFEVNISNCKCKYNYTTLTGQPDTTFKLTNCTFETGINTDYSSNTPILFYFNHPVKSLIMSNSIIICENKEIANTITYGSTNAIITGCMCDSTVDSTVNATNKKSSGNIGIVNE